MQFLFNEHIVQALDEVGPAFDPAFPLPYHDYQKIGPAKVIELACWIYADAPQFLQQRPDLAARLAGLISSKCAANAARIGFDANRKPAMMLANLEVNVLADFTRRAQHGELCLEDVDRELWSRLRKR